MTKKVFMTWGGWDGHQPEETSALFADLLRGRGLTVDRVDTLEPLADKEKMASYDLIVPVWTMSKISNEQIAGLREAVMGGVGIGGWHGGFGDSFRECTDYQWICGGQWVAHPGNRIDYTVQIVKDDPITAGLAKEFAMNSEQYYMHTDPGNEVLATTVIGQEHAPWAGGTVMPVAWKRHFGKGRVFYSSLGHDVKDFDVPEARELTLRGLLWAAHCV